MHATMSLTANSRGVAASFTAADAIREYSLESGYDPATGRNDNGCNILSVLKRRQKLGLAGHTIRGYARLDPNNVDQLKAAVYLFGNVEVGLDLPLSAQPPAAWSDPSNTRGRNAPGSWGGHDVPLLGYDDTGFWCVTWGQPKHLSWGFWQTYGSEAWTAFSDEWMTLAGPAPSGLNLDQLYADIAALGGDPGPRPVPNPTPDPYPSPPPSPDGFALGHGAPWNFASPGNVVIALRFIADDGTEYDAHATVNVLKPGVYKTTVLAARR
jgi:hypothetical protein